MSLFRGRVHGDEGPEVIVLHGGPAGVGNAGPMARGLADQFRVLEPWQRGSGGEPLTVDRHVADIESLIEMQCACPSPALIGESWGAMLALAYGAEHPERACPLVLVGCGTFDAATRAQLRETLKARQDAALREQVEAVAEAATEEDEARMELYRLTRTLYDYDILEEPDEDLGEPFDMQAHLETWEDMVRQQEAGRYPAAFAAIRGPVLMLHGTYDPHPGEMVRDSLLPYVPQLTYHTLDRCGHSPWLERYAREEFFAVLREWLAEHCSPGDAGAR
jgi:pimeloyl-ACP methyl ester carboxylesterase